MTCKNTLLTKEEWQRIVDQFIIPSVRGEIHNLERTLRTELGLEKTSKRYTLCPMCRRYFKNDE